MILHVGVTQEAIDNIDSKDTMISTDIVKAINEIAHDRLIVFRDINHECRIDYETARAIV